jgi:hypothetical protein
LENIHLYIERAIHLRKLGGAGLFALGTAKIFNPTVAGRRLPNMRLRRPGSSQSSCHNQTDPDDARHEHAEVAIKDAFAAARRQVDDLA